MRFKTSNKISRQAISIFLAVVMIFSTLPSTAYASMTQEGGAGGNSSQKLSGGYFNPIQSGYRISIADKINLINSLLKYTFQNHGYPLRIAFFHFPHPPVLRGGLRPPPTAKRAAAAKG